MSIKNAMKKNIALSLCALTCTLLILFSNEAMAAAKNGFDLWLSAVMPALFPFFVCTTLMGEAGIFKLISFGKKALGSFSIGSLIVFLISGISGAPCGARVCAMLLDCNAVKEDKITQLCAAINMISPMFITGSLASVMLNEPKAALPIAVGHYTAAFIAMMFALCNNRPKIAALRPALTKRTVFRPLPALSNALSEGAVSMVKICGMIIFFMVVLRVVAQMGVIDFLLAPLSKLNIDPTPIAALITGSVEVTGGCAALAGIEGMPLTLKCALMSFTITLGGICVLAQSLSFVELKTTVYLRRKFMTAILAGLISYGTALITLPDSVATIGEITASPDMVFKNAISAGGIFLASSLGLGTVGLLAVAVGKLVKSKVYTTVHQQ